MTKYTCEKCLRDFSQKSHYDKHKNKKRPCQDNKSKIQEVVEQLIDEKLQKKLNTINTNNINLSNMKTFVDLFSGTGAFSYVLENNNYKCVFANDMVSSSKDIYNLNNENNIFNLADLNNIKVYNIPKHSMLCGGFPCQPFSIAGEKKGFEDERSNVFWKILEILEYHKPNTIILENVKNLVSHKKGNTFKIIMDNLTRLGYLIKYKVLDTSEITKIPQHRERIYIVGFLDKDKYDKFNFDFPKVNNNLIVDFLEVNIPKKYYYTDKFKVNKAVQEGVKKNILENTLYQYRRYYVRENKSNCCPTLTANMGGGGHNVPLLRDDKGVRKLTPRECFNLQGFPRNYKLPKLCDSALYKLAGNAVSIPVVDLIVKKLK